jgi:predicted O-methyltransferase YrrM
MRLQQTRAVIDRVLSAGTVVARSDGSTHTIFPVGVSLAEGEALRAWVQREGAAQTIEIGFGYGISALFICEGLLSNGNRNGRHVVVDPNQSTRFADCGLQLVEEAGLGDIVEFHAEGSEIALPRFLAEGRGFDLAFVDGNHRFEGVFLDLVYLGRLVRGGGVVIVDDYQLSSVVRAVSFCTTNLGWTLEEVSRDDEHHGWAVIRTAREPMERAFDHFVDF